MKRQIRRGIFETNSSSTHVISIQKQNVIDNPDVANGYFNTEADGLDTILSVDLHDFGWEHAVYYDFDDKMAYFLIALDAFRTKVELDKCLETIKGWLNEVHIEITFPKYIDKDETINYKDGSSYTYHKRGWLSGKSSTYYIDHSEGLGDFVQYIMEDKNHFYNFLFGKLSKIETGNDNDGTFPWWYNKDFKDFHDKFEHYKDWWVGEGDDPQKVYDEMAQELSDDDFHTAPDDVVEFYKGN